MAISADMVKKLREQSGAGMMDCKKALTQTDGDFDKAMTVLREKGMAVAAKREARAASEGVIGSYISEDGQVGVLVELNCETTFVAKTDEFNALAHNIAMHIARVSPDISDCNDVSCLMEQPFVDNTDVTIKDMVNDVLAKLGEKTSVARFARIDVGGRDHSYNGAIGSYIHMGSQIVVFVEMKCESDAMAQSPELQQLAKDIAMHICWGNPEYFKTEDVSEEVIAAERDIYRQYAIKEGKPENIIERIVDGKIKEFYSRACLMEQAYVKDADLTIAKLVKTFSRDAGEEVEVAGFKRFRVGETSGDAE